MPRRSCAPIVRLKAGDPFVQATLDAAVAGIRGLYRARGFTQAMVMPMVAVLPAGDRPPPAADRHVQVTIAVTEGPRTLVGAVDLAGNMVLTAEQIRASLSTVPGKAYSELDVASDRDRIDLEYRNRGYESVVVDPRVMLADANTRANVLFTISEGPQVIVDHVIIIGNKRTSTATIQRELTLRPGEPLGYAARIESQQRLSALGLFRRVNITELTHESESRRDVLVQVEEAPPTTISLRRRTRGQTILRPTGPNRPGGGTVRAGAARVVRGDAQQPVGQEPIDRSVHARQPAFARRARRAIERERARGVHHDQQQLRHQRVPRARHLSRAEGVQHARPTCSSPRFSTRRSDRASTSGRAKSAAKPDCTSRPGSASRDAIRFSTPSSSTSNFAPDDPVVPLIDRLFPQVRLSKFSNSLIRDNRDDLLDPSRGAFLALNSDVAARAIGSEVGFVKTFAQAFEYYRLPVRRRIILRNGGTRRTGARLSSRGRDG